MTTSLGPVVWMLVVHLVLDVLLKWVKWMWLMVAVGLLTRLVVVLVFLTLEAGVLPELLLLQPKPPETVLMQIVWHPRQNQGDELHISGLLLVSHILLGCIDSV